MTTVNTPESWPDVSPLPVIQTGNGDLYFHFPAESTLNRSRDALRSAGYRIRLLPEQLGICVQDVDPLPLLRRVTSNLTPAELADTLALLRPCGVSVTPADAILAMNVERLRNRFASTWLIDLLREARLSCVFQPIVSTFDRQSVQGYEALTRGNRNGEVVEPARMIEVAKNAHVMPQFDALAMRTALEEAAKNKIDGMLFVNCSPMHIYDPTGRMNDLGAYCERLGLRRENVIFEIVESEHHDPAHLKIFLRACRLQRFRVALDDIGSGYSSLSALAELRPDIIKIERDLITGINTDPYRALIVNRLLDATRVLGITTIVEGVETDAEFEWARANGATYVQGYLTGKPAPLAALN